MDTRKYVKSYNAEDTYLRFTDFRDHSKATHIESHQNRRRTIIVKCVQRFEERFKLILGEDIVVIVPGIQLLGVDFEFKTRDDTKLVPGTLHAPVKDKVSVLGPYYHFLSSIQKTHHHRSGCSVSFTRMEEPSANTMFRLTRLSLISPYCPW
jgi:hypothetical protein